MTNYITYTDVEYAYYGLSGDTFTSAQQTVVTNLITQAHGAIVGYLDSEPADNANLSQIEIEITLNLLWNTRNRDKEPRPALTEDIKFRLDQEHEGLADDVLFVVSSMYEE